MSCQIKNGQYFAPNENPSILYKELSQQVGEEKAGELFVYAYSNEFTNSYLVPLKSSYKSKVFQALDATRSYNGEAKYKTLEVNGFRTLQMFQDGKMLGYIRMKPFKDGMQIERVNLSAGTKKGQVIGKELYIRAIKDTLRRDVPLYSDNAQTQDALRVWESLSDSGVVTKEGVNFKVNNLPQSHFDSNGEIKASKLIQRVGEENKTEESLSFVEQLQVRDMMIQFPEVENSTELYNQLEKAFYTEGMFFPTQDSLKDIYNEYEIEVILSDTSLQGRIKSAIDKLRNTSEINNNSYDIEYLDTLNELNIFGKSNVNNPLRFQSDLIQDFAGTENLEETLLTVESTSFQKKDKEPIIEELNRYVRIPQIDEQGNTILNEPFYPEFFKEFTDMSVIRALDTLIQMPSDLANTEQAKEVMQGVEESLLEIGLDIRGFNEFENYQSILPSLQDFLINENVEPFKAQYLEFKSAEQTIKEVPTIIENKERNYKYLETELSEQELFDNLNLVQTAVPNVYHKVNKIDFEELKTIIEAEDTISEIDAYKEYFGYPREVQYPQREVLSESFTGVSSDFISDFYVEILKAEEGDFYSNFKVTEKGIELISDDILTIGKVKAYIKDGVKLGRELEQYSLLSKSMPNLIDKAEFTVEDKISQRISAVNNKRTVEKPNNILTTINNNMVTVKNTQQPYIKIGEDIYEAQQVIGEDTYYLKVYSEANSTFNDFNPSVFTAVPLKDFLNKNISNDTKIKKSWKKETVGDMFDCI
jgi:hypothetical protein